MIKAVLSLAFICILAFVATVQAQTNGSNWVILVAGSNGYYNYRHQSDIYHAYQLYKKNGIPESQIIVFHYDDIANSPDNPKQGTVINQYNGPNNYPGVPKDYVGSTVTPQTFLDLLSGKDMGPGKKSLKSGANDNVFIYFADHGATGLIAFPGFVVLHASDLITSLKSMYQNKQYKKMVFYIEACESGSMFAGILPSNMNIYGVTAANPFESSYACMDSDIYQTYLNDCFSLNFLNDTQNANIKKETLQQQFDIVKQITSTSHVCQYGDLTMSSEPLSNYMSGSSSRLSAKKQGKPALPYTGSRLESRNIKKSYLKNMLKKSTTTLQKLRWAKEYAAHKASATRANMIFGTLSHNMELHKVRDQKLAASSNDQDHCTQQAVHDVVCMKKAVQSMEKHCGMFNEESIQYASYLNDACAAYPHKEIDAKLAQICSVIKM